MMIRPGEIYCDKHIRQFRLQMFAFECILRPVTAATEIHRSERKAGFIEIDNRSLEALVTGSHLEKGVI